MSNRFNIATGKFPKEPKREKTQKGPSPIGPPNPEIDTFYFGKDGEKIPVHPTDINMSTTMGANGRPTIQINMAFNITPEQSVTLSSMIRNYHRTNSGRYSLSGPLSSTTNDFSRG